MTSKKQNPTKKPESLDVSRRGLIGGAAAAAVGAAAMRTAVSKTLAPFALGGSAEAIEIGPLVGLGRARKALELRRNLAAGAFAEPLATHPTNGDEAKYPDKRSQFSKALKHDTLGNVELPSWDSLITALTTGNPADYNAIQMGSLGKLGNPQAALAFNLIGNDNHQIQCPPFPTFDSAELAANMVEVYWMALCRDIHFDDWATHPLIAKACTDLSNLTGYKGPKEGGVVTPNVVFRGNESLAIGPHASQFDWMTIRFGDIDVPQRIRATVPNLDYITTQAKWLSVQRGVPQPEESSYDPIPRYVRNLRDYAEYVHRDFTYQLYLQTALILLDVSTFNPPLNPTNPYLSSTTQGGFVTHGPAMIVGLLGQVADLALKATWHLKWNVHRPLRPEALAGRVHMHLTGQKTFDLHPELLNSMAVAEVFSKHGTYFCPQSYPEGSPAHPSYPAGHATLAGACGTLIKAFFDENFILPTPVTVNTDGTALLPFSGPSLSVLNEVHKIMWDTGQGRNAAGIHYRVDAEESILLGEQVAIKMLRDMKASMNEGAGWVFTGWKGNTIII